MSFSEHVSHSEHDVQTRALTRQMSSSVLTASSGSIASVAISMMNAGLEHQHDGAALLTSAGLSEASPKIKKALVQMQQWQRIVVVKTVLYMSPLTLTGLALMVFVIFSFAATHTDSGQSFTCEAMGDVALAYAIICIVTHLLSAVQLVAVLRADQHVYHAALLIMRLLFVPYVGCWIALQVLFYRKLSSCPNALHDAVSTSIIFSYSLILLTGLIHSGVQNSMRKPLRDLIRRWTDAGIRPEDIAVVLNMVWYKAQRPESGSHAQQHADERSHDVEMPPEPEGKHGGGRGGGGGGDSG